MTLKLNGSTDGSVSIDAPADTSPTGSDITLTLPTTVGSANQFVKNGGTAGELEYSSMVETSTGVGIGTSSPGEEFVVRADAPSIQLESSNASGRNYGFQSNNDGKFFIYDGTAGANRVTLDASGRLLVNHTADTAPDGFESKIQTVGTDFRGGSLSIRRDENGTSGAALLLTKSRSTSKGGNTIVQNGDNLGTIWFYGADGNDVNQAGGKIECLVDGTPGSNDMPGRLSFFTTADGSASPTERMKIHNDGTLRVQGVYDFTLASSANVHVDSGGLIRRVTSSAKYKTNIETIEDSYADALLNCRPVWYQSTCEGDNPDYSWWGFIAEEVAEIDPRLVHWKTTNVTYDEDGQAVEAPCDPEAEGVLYDRFVPHLVNLIKRQKTRIETLETQNTAQQAQIDDLLARVTALEAAE